MVKSFISAHILGLVSVFVAFLTFRNRDFYTAIHRTVCVCLDLRH